MSKSVNNNKSFHLCPCGSGHSFSACCQIIFNDHTKATTPEMLMRSRYSAYVLGNTSHLLKTWDNLFRPESLTLDDNCKWVKLEIIKSSKNDTEEKTGFVHFKAFFINNRELITLSEMSQFIKKDENWYYQNGETEYNKVTIPLKSPCPCGSGRKFKRCCM